MAKKPTPIPNLGSRDLGSIQVPDDMGRVFDRRRELIRRIEEKLDFATKKTEINKLTRQLNAVIVTDPREFLYHDKWATKGLKDIQSHHITGLDDYADAFRGMSDSDLFDLHNDAAERGIYFGNHPKNKADLHRSRHVGQTRRYSPGRESVHGESAYTRLTSDQMDEYIHNPSKDIGSQDSFEPSGRKRAAWPTADEWADMDQNTMRDKLFWFAEQDQQTAGRALQKPVKPVAMEGKIPTFVRDNIVSKIPQDRMSLQLQAALQSGDWDTAKELGKAEVKQFKGVRIGEQLENLKQHTKSIQGVGGKFRATDSVAQLASGNYVGGGIGLALQNPAVQKAIAKRFSKFAGKQAAGLAPGVGGTLSALEAMGYTKQGRFTQATIAGLSGLVGEIPGVGDALSGALDLTNTGIDILTGNLGQPDIEEQHKHIDASRTDLAANGFVEGFDTKRVRSFGNLSKVRL